MNVALISSNKWLNKCIDDGLLQAALLNANINTKILSWEKDSDWKLFDLVLIRSTWDYYQNYEGFCDWLIKLDSSGIRVANGVKKILSNINKELQFKELIDCPIPLIPYCICNSVEEACEWVVRHNYSQIVIKPTISAGGYKTVLYRNLDDMKAAISGFLLTEKGVIVQPYVPEVLNGEISLIYFHGKYSHAVVRNPGIIGTRRPPQVLSNPDQEIITAGNQVIKHLKAEGQLYTRIDLIRYQGMISIMEVEMAEPPL